MIRGYVSSDEDDSDEYDFGYSEPLVIKKPAEVPFPEVRNVDFKEKLQAALQENQLYKLFFDAVEEGDLSALRELVSHGVDVDYSPPQEWTALMKACVAGKHEVVRFLLENGSNPSKHKELFTPLMACCTHTLVSEDLKLSCVRLLLQHGADVNAKDKYRTTALMYATGSGYANIVTELLQVPNIKVNLQDREGWTALFYAVNLNDSNLVEKLISAGTDLKLKDNSERTAVLLALDKDLMEVAEMLGYEEEVCSDLAEEEVFLSSRFLSELPDSNGKGGYFADAKCILSAFNQENVKDISLPDLLNATEEDLYDIGVKLQYDRFNILSKGIHRFHLEPWKKTSMHHLTEGVTLKLESIIAITGSIARHLTVVNASLKYLGTRISIRKDEELVNLTKDKEMAMVLINAFVVAEKLKALLPKILKHAEQVRQEISPDYICPKIKPNGKKKYFWCAIGGAATAGLLIYYFRADFHLKPAVAV